jgi:hypothetical protein
MGRRFGVRRPSPATAISLVALVFAVTGTAVAGVAAVSVLSKQEKKQTRKIAKAEVRRAAPRLSVANAVNAQNAINAQSAVNAQSAINAQNAVSADALGGAAGAKLPVAINAAWDTNGSAQANEPLGTFGDLTVTGRCTNQGTDDPELRIILRNDGAGGPGNAQIALVHTGGQTDDSTSQDVSTSDSTLLVVEGEPPPIEAAGMLVYSDNAQVTVIDLRLEVEWDLDAFCEIAGQATTTPSP